MILLPPDFYEIKHTKAKGRGIFAQKDIAPGTIIGDYLGKVINIAQEDTSEKNGLYLLYYHDHAAIYPIDVNAPGIHLLNHSCTPNCWLYVYKGHTLFFTLRKIFAGEELTASYLLSPDEFCKPCPHACKCGSPFCSQTMHLTNTQFKKWQEYNEKESAKTKKARIRYGKTLPKLLSYPTAIADNAIYTLFGARHKSPLLLVHKTLPELAKLRQLLKLSGRTLHFPNLKIIVLGIQDNRIITTPEKE